ncbi:MAG: hypothetical protein QM578_03275 [Pantoea sp.]|uniref:hypothetical protein n=1 Tax=Pantoea sp. TaxID=69393 RepID=UPI0039E4099E
MATESRKRLDLAYSHDGKDEIIGLRHSDFIIISMNIIVFLKRFQPEIARVAAHINLSPSDNASISQMIFNSLSTEKVDNFAERPARSARQMILRQ